MANSPDDRSPMAIGLGWATVIMTISAEMVVPALLGFWVDKRLGTRFLFLLAGLAVGVTLATLGLVRLARQSFDSPDDKSGNG